MKLGATFSAFDILVVPFPFTERLANKRRPALVLSSTLFNQDHEQLLLGMITSSTTDSWPSDTPIKKWREAGLTVPCKVRFKVFTLPKSMTLDRLGELANEDRPIVEGRLARIVGSGLLRH